ncbi:MAG: hypothetical protein MUC76_11525 [Spirochaetes bacterium]|jgi:hypothetical protein|nr:hypothetical protein [Spirochaetota bacterium]
MDKNVERERENAVSGTGKQRKLLMSYKNIYARACVGKCFHQHEPQTANGTFWAEKNLTAAACFT